MKNEQVKDVGVYLLGISLLQICLYLLMSRASGASWLFYFDPRISLFFLETSVRGTEQAAPGVLRWLSAGWIFVLSLLLLRGRPNLRIYALRAYIVSELLLLIPSIIFFLIVILSSLSSTHGFSVGELVLPALIIVVFSIIPLRLASVAEAGSPAVESTAPDGA
jgi:hypothetical protein